MENENKYGDKQGTPIMWLRKNNLFSTSYGDVMFNMHGKNVLNFK